MRKVSSPARWSVRCLTLLALTSALGCADVPQPAATEAETGDLRTALEQRIAESGAQVAVAMRTLDGRDELLLDADESFHAASTMKVPIMVELFRQRHDGLLSLDDPLEVTNRFASIVDGSPYELSVDDDSDADVYQHVGETMPLGELCEAMITSSSNLAANLLIERLGVDNIRRTTAALGADGMQVLRGVEDIKAFEAGQNNTTTARGLLILLERIADGEAVDADSSRQMVAILERQRFNEGIPAGLPAGTQVAHKTGNITAIHHDAAIVYAPRPFVLVVLVRGIEEIGTSGKLIADIAQIVYEHTQGKT